MLSKGLVALAAIALAAGCTATVTSSGPRRGSPPPTATAPEGSPPPTAAAPEGSPPPTAAEPEGSPPPTAAAPEESPPPTAAAPGARLCTASSDCPEGQTCRGDEGCDAAWTCQPARPCTRDLVPYCGCDGETFRASGSCPGKRYRHRGRCEGPPTGPSKVTRPGRSCTTTADCARGQICSGEAGCDAAWTCQPSRPCTRDLAPFCGCDGQTFRTSGSCPGKRYRHRGRCKASEASRPPGERPPAAKTCRSTADCGRGESCRGSAGCDATWTCVPDGPCTADLVPYCGCDGRTFRASGTCPGRRYSKRGPCAGESAPPAP